MEVLTLMGEVEGELITNLSYPRITTTTGNAICVNSYIYSN